VSLPLTCAMSGSLLSAALRGPGGFNVGSLGRPHIGTTADLRYLTCRSAGRRSSACRRDMLNKNEAVERTARSEIEDVT
jgi:hypothetical protein